MSFPHRTWFYDIENDEIKLPETGLAITSSRSGKVVIDILNPSRGEVTDRYIPLGSTGIEAKDGVEVIEGSILYSEYADELMVTIWCDLRGEWRLYNWTLCPTLPIYPSVKDEEAQVRGHVLTEPDLSPNGFNPSEYWPNYE